MRYRRLLNLAAFAAIGTLFVGVNADAASSYSSTKIPRDPKRFTVIDFNNSNQVLLHDDHDDPEDLKIVIENWSNGARSPNTTTLGGVPGTGSRRGVASEFNDTLQVAIYAQLADARGRFPSDAQSYALLFSDGRYTDLSALPPLKPATGRVNSMATGINNLGEVVGHWTDEATRSFVYSRGVIATISAPTGGSDVRAGAINNLGQIVGSYRTTAGELRTFITEAGATRDLGIGESSAPTDINDRGDVLGVVNRVGSTRCFTHRAGQTTVFGALANASLMTCTPRKINSAGVAVGYVSAAGNASASGPFVIDGGQMWNLNSLIGPNDELARNDTRLTDVLSINDSGVLVARSSNSYYLLTPIANAPPPVTPPTPAPSPSPSPSPSPAPSPSPSPSPTPAPAPSPAPTPAPAEPPPPTGSATAPSVQYNEGYKPESGAVDVFALVALLMIALAGRWLRDRSTNS